MNDKPTKWDYLTTTFILSICGTWAFYDYKSEPNKIPFEPIVAVTSSCIILWGYFRWKKRQATTEENNAGTVPNSNLGNHIESSQNVVTHSQIDSKRDVIIGNQTIIYKDGREISRFLTNPPFNADFFIGRENDMQIIESEYQKNNRLLVLVNGEGGIGKTTLASKYWYAHESRYKHLAWLYADAGIGSALLNLALPLGISFDPKDDTKTQIRRITEGVNNLDMPCLLVFDNANNDTDLAQYYVTLKQLTRCHILLTSRVAKLGDIKAHVIKPLGETDAINIFKQYYQKHEDSETPLLLQILQAVGKNTLVIELLAKNLAVSNDFDTTYTLKELLTDLQKKGLFAIQNEVVETVYQADTLRQETPDKIIEAMYDLSKLSDAEKQILSNFAVLPPDNIGFELIKDLIKPKDERLFKQTLRDLSRKGWLEHDEAKKDFKISPIVQEITKRKNEERLLTDCRSLIDALMEGLNDDNRHTDNYQTATMLARLGESLIQAIPMPDFGVSVLCQNIGEYHKDTGNLYLMLQCYQKMLDIQIALCAGDSNNADFKSGLAVAYEKIGVTYSDLGNLSDALKSFKKETELFEELYATYPQNVECKYALAISYEKLGKTYNALGDSHNALIFFKQRYQLSNELYTAYPQSMEFKHGLAISYEKLGDIYKDFGNLDDALSFFNEYNKLSEQLCAFDAKNMIFKDSLAISYSKLGDIYNRLGNMDKTLTYMEKSLKLLQELYGLYCNNVSFKNGLAIAYGKIGEVYIDLGKLDTALMLFEVQEIIYKELCDIDVNNVSFKDGLAISYCKLGDTHSKLNNLDKALEFFEEYHRLSKQLHTSYPNNVSFKSSLAISCFKLGSIHISLGGLDNVHKAIEFFKNQKKIYEELCNTDAANVSFKNGLAISYEKLGDIHNSLNNLDKALGFYEGYNRLEKELYAAYPNNVDFKNNLAISYCKLGNTHGRMSNVEKSLEFFELYNQLEKELYSANLNNVNFKNGLAVSYYKLGEISKMKKDHKQAKTYFQSAEKLWLELVRDAPQYVQFQEFLGIVQKDIQALD